MVMHINTDACTACGDCAAVCPNQAITKKNGCYVVNPDKCTTCAPQAVPTCQDVCPAHSIEAA